MYYARNNEEREFDNEMRERIRKHGTKAEMALYIQNQEILNILRHIDNNIKDLARYVEKIR